MTWSTTRATKPYFASSAQCGDIVGDDQVFGSAFFRSTIDPGGAIEHLADRDPAHV
jgi:hypothetical protein